MLSGLESSGWLKHIHLILEVAVFTAKVSVTDNLSLVKLYSTVCVYMYVTNSGYKIISH